MLTLNAFREMIDFEKALNRIWQIQRPIKAEDGSYISMGGQTLFYSDICDDYSITEESMDEQG